MMKSVIPELHDLLKLVGSSGDHMCPERRHQSALSAIRDTPLWYSLSHHCVGPDHRENCSIYPISKDQFCLHYADVLASIISRTLREIYSSRTTFHVWHDDVQKFDSTPLKPMEIQDVLDASVRPAGFLQRKELKLRPEETGAPFSSLYTHSTLTKRWYEFLISNTEYFHIDDKIEEKEDTRCLLQNIEENKWVYLCYAKIATETVMVRMRDTNILRALRTVLNECVRTVGGCLLYDLSEEAVFVLPKEASQDSTISTIRSGLASNFHLEMVIKETRLPYKNAEIENQFRVSVSSLFSDTRTRVYPKLPLEISPNLNNLASRKAIICDLCQKAPATDVRSKDTTEYLCRSCFTLRQESQGYSQIADWERRGNVKIALVEIFLDTSNVAASLTDCFNQYLLKEIKKPQTEKTALGFSVLFEFLLKYEEFLDATRTALSGIFRNDNIIQILNGLFVARLTNTGDIMKIVEAFLDNFQTYFRRLHQIEKSPIHLSILSANVKFPFAELWRILQVSKRGLLLGADDKRGTVFVHMIGKGTINAEIWKLRGILGLYKSLSRRGNYRALHKLAEVAKLSETLAGKLLVDRGNNRDQELNMIYRQLSDPRRPYDLDYDSILTMAKLLGDEP